MKYNDTIQHFGIKGMKWGHRNRREHLMNKYISKGYDMNSAVAKTEKRLKIEKAAEQLNKIRKTNEQIKSGKNSKIKGFWRKN